jgi:hypothetical protein
MKKTMLLIGLTLMCLSGYAQNTVTGYVYEDLNANGKRERREKGLPDVSVSNGIEVVKTDAQGQYVLPIGEDQIVFVIKPSDYALPKNENNLPKFFYSHKPKGSPTNLKYAGLSPTGDLPKSVDFGLLPSPTENKFTALVFGDPQPYDMTELGYFEKGVVDEVAGIQGIRFGISVGDIAGDDLSLYPAYAKTIGKVGVPWFSVMGNHDMNLDAAKDELTDETFESFFGPATYAFNEGEAHFIVLENILYPDPRDGQGYWGGLRADQLQFVENNLKLVPKDKLVVVFMHIPLFEEGESYRDEDREKLLELLSDFPNTVSLSAHTHYQKQTFFGKAEGYNQNKAHHHYNIGTPSGDWYSGRMRESGVPESTMRDGSPNGYVFLDFEGNQYKARYKAAGKPDTYQMEIFAPKVLEKGKRTSTGIVVNFFMGTANDEVRYRIDNGEWRKMTNLTDYDPSYLLKIFEWDTTETLLDGRRPSNAVRTDHLWRAGIPVNLEVGVHTIEVEATDMFGQKHTGTKTFRIEQ